MAVWGSGHASYQRSGDNGNTITKTEDGDNSLYGAVWLDGSAQSVYQWKVRYLKGRSVWDQEIDKRIIFGFVALGHHVDVNKKWYLARPSYGDQWNNYPDGKWKDGSSYEMKCPSIDFEDEVVYSLDCIKKEIRVRVTAKGVRGVMTEVLFRDIEVGNGQRYKLAMRMYYKDQRVTVTQLHSDVVRVSELQSTSALAEQSLAALRRENHDLQV